MATDNINFGPYYRHLGEHNAGEYEKVVKTNEVWGREAKTLASGLCVQAVPLALANGIVGYNFQTQIAPKESLGFPLKGPPIVREVFWFEGSPGVEIRENGHYVAISVNNVRKGQK